MVPTEALWLSTSYPYFRRLAETACPIDRTELYQGRKESQSKIQMDGPTKGYYLIGIYIHRLRK
jgi:hypothetical protein